jgi:hypothetical protein
MQSELEVPMQVSEAERTLQEVARVRRATRRDLHPLWYANLVVGLFFLGATLVAAVATGPALPIAYWAVAAPAGLALIVRDEVRRERALGAESRWTDPAMGILAAIAAGIFALNQLTSGSFGDVAWIYAVAAGWAAMAALYRDALMGAAAVALAVIGTGVAAVEPASPGLWAQGALALLLVAAGVAGRSWERG